jgi:hypothetical protein
MIGATNGWAHMGHNLAQIESVTGDGIMRPSEHHPKRFAFSIGWNWN